MSQSPHHPWWIPILVVAVLFVGLGLLVKRRLNILENKWQRTRRKTKCLERKCQQAKSSRCQHECCPSTTTIVQNVTPAPTPTPTFFLWERTAFVDSKYGSNTTGAVERPDLPFLTIQAAIDAAATLAATDTSKWQVWIRPGVYTEDITLQLGVDIMGQSPPAKQTSTEDVIVNGSLTWSPTAALSYTSELLVQSIQVNSTDEPALTIGASVADLFLTVTNSVLYSNWTIATQSPSTTEAITIDLRGGAEISYTFDQCVVVTNIAATTVTTPAFTPSAVVGGPVDLQILRSHLTVVMSILDDSDAIPYTVQIVRHVTEGIDSSLTSFANQYEFIVVGGEDGLVPDEVHLFSMTGTSLTTEVLVLMSQADMWTNRPFIEVLLSDVPQIIVAMAGTGAALVSTVQDMMIQSYLPGEAVSSPLSVDGVNTDLTCRAYFRGLVWGGLDTLAAPATIDETEFILRQIDILTDLNQVGQFYPGTVVVVNTPPIYAVEPTDAIVHVTDNLATPVTEIQMPDANLYPGRNVTVKNATSATTFVVSSPFNASPDLGVGFPVSPGSVGNWTSLHLYAQGGAWWISASHYLPP